MTEIEVVETNMKKRWNGNHIGRIKSCALIVLMAAALLAAPLMQVNAADGYIAKWKEYQAASDKPEDYAWTWNEVVDAMDAVLDRGKELYAAGDTQAAYKAVSDAYYGYYETTGFERIAMGYISGSRKTEMELQFSACKSVAKKNGTLEDFTAQVDLLEQMLRADANQLDGVSGDSESSGDSNGSTSDNTGGGNSGSGSTTAQRSAAMATFIACFGIILREGLEAILIVGAIIAYLHKGAGEDEERRKKTLRPVYIGSVLGIVMSFGLAWLLSAIKLANTASQEMIEGITALLAVCVLYYVSNWMFSKSETDAWVSYIKDKAETSSAKGSFFALGFTAFLAVFREGAEVVLFFQPLMSDENIHAVWIGLIVGFIVLAFVYLAIHYLSLRIPTKPFFLATSILMYIMSISFLGAGIKELIEADLITMTSPAWVAWIPTNDFLDVLGIYPCVQTIVPQLILLVITIVLVVIQAKKNREIHAAAEERRAKERAEQEAAEKKVADEALRKVVREVVMQVLAEQGIVKAQLIKEQDKQDQEHK